MYSIQNCDSHLGMFPRKREALKLFNRSKYWICESVSMDGNVLTNSIEYIRVIHLEHRGSIEPLTLVISLDFLSDIENIFNHLLLIQNNKRRTSQVCKKMRLVKRHTKKINF